jgi:hypothetical protein
MIHVHPAGTPLEDPIAAVLAAMDVEHPDDQLHLIDTETHVLYVIDHIDARGASLVVDLFNRDRDAFQRYCAASARRRQERGQ